MIPEEEVYCVEGKHKTRQFFERHPEFDCAGVRSNGAIEGYFEKNQPEQFVALDKSDLIGDSTRLMDLLGYFEEHRRLFFVLSGNEVCGLVHYSDINNPVLRVPFYALIAATEHHCYSAIRESINEETICRAVKALENRPGKGWADNRIDKIKKDRKKTLEKDIDRGWNGILYIGEILKLAQQEQRIPIENESIENIRQIRNRVTHNDDSLLVQNLEDVKLASKVRDECRRLLNVEY